MLGSFCCLNHRFTEWPALVGSLKIIQFHPCHGWGCHSLDQVVWGITMKLTLTAFLTLRCLELEDMALVPADKGRQKFHVPVCLYKVHVFMGWRAENSFFFLIITVAIWCVSLLHSALEIQSCLNHCCYGISDTYYSISMSAFGCQCDVSWRSCYMMRVIKLCGSGHKCMSFQSFGWALQVYFNWVQEEALQLR